MFKIYVILKRFKRLGLLTNSVKMLCKKIMCEILFKSIQTSCYYRRHTQKRTFFYIFEEDDIARSAGLPNQQQRTFNPVPHSVIKITRELHEPAMYLSFVDPPAALLFFISKYQDYSSITRYTPFTGRLFLHTLNSSTL